MLTVAAVVVGILVGALAAAVLLMSSSRSSPLPEPTVSGVSVRRAVVSVVALSSAPADSTHRRPT